MKIRKPLHFQKTKISRGLSLLILFIVALVQIGCATSSPVAEQKEITLDNQAMIEDRWGVKILPIRLTANDYMIDFRFEVIDADKARPLIAKDAKPNLIDETSGAKLSVPDTGKLGSLRAKGKPIDNRTYFIIYSNPKGLVKKGSKVTVVIGDFKAENLVVE